MELKQNRTFNFLIYLLIGSSFLGANMLAVSLPWFTVSIFRLTFLVLSIFVFIALFNIIRKKQILNSWNYIKPNNKLDLSIYIYLLWPLFSLISVLWATDKVAALQNTIFIGIGSISIFYIYIGISDFKKLRVGLWFSVVFISIHHMFGWYEIITANHIFPRTSLPGYRVENFPISSLGNPNNLATLVLIGLVLGLILLASENNNLAKFFLVAFSISSVGIILQSSSKANVLALAFFAAIIVLVYIFDLFKIKFTSKRFITSAIVIGVLGVIAVIALLSVTGLIDDIIVAFENPNVLRESSLSNRVNQILNGFRMLINSFGLGVGAGNIEHYMQQAGMYPVDTYSIHSWFLEILFSFGVIFFIVYMVYYIYLIYKTVKLVENSNGRIKFILVVILAYLFAFIVSSFSSSSLFHYSWVWVNLGIIHLVLIFANNCISKREEEAILT